MLIIPLPLVVELSILVLTGLEREGKRVLPEVSGEALALFWLPVIPVASLLKKPRAPPKEGGEDGSGVSGFEGGLLPPMNFFPLESAPVKLRLRPCVILAGRVGAKVTAGLTGSEMSVFPSLAFGVIGLGLGVGLCAGERSSGEGVGAGFACPVVTGRWLRSPGASGAIPKSTKSLGSGFAGGLVGDAGWLGTSAMGEVAGLIMGPRFELNLSLPKRPDFFGAMD